ncbi:MAG: UDP-N-acetylmuramate dehydrogenase [Phycisphaeraceae bacterium]|nr:UDP-N-acetylmuramate dehydrogenase [Phycisphaeraceae bacterium]
MGRDAMTTVRAQAEAVRIENDVLIPTWFHIGGRADQLARPESASQLRTCLLRDPELRMLGDGANLLVDDDGVRELVVQLTGPEFTGWTFDEATGLLSVGAGANLPKLILEAVRRGRGGLEGLGGIPASIGGALVMNAGGAFGQIADTVVRVHGLTREGQPITLERDEIDFRYRHSGLDRLIITRAELELSEEDPAGLRDRLKEVMHYKKQSQPMGDRSAGCVFKNPVLPADIEGIGPRGERVSAGMLIDRAGCKGLAVRGASVSARHANFIVTAPDAHARDVIDLMADVRRRVHDAFGVEIEPEIVVWSSTR